MDIEEEKNERKIAQTSSRYLSTVLNENYPALYEHFERVIDYFCGIEQKLSKYDSSFRDVLIDDAAGALAKMINRETFENGRRTENTKPRIIRQEEPARRDPRKKRAVQKGRKTSKAPRPAVARASGRGKT